MTPRTWVEVYKGRNGWRFRVRSGNNKTIAPSQAYTRRASAKRGALRLLGADVEIRYV